MAVSAVISQAGVISAKYVPLRRFFSSIRNGPSKSVIVVYTVATLPQMVGSYCSRGTASNSTWRFGDDFTGVKTSPPYWAWRSWISCPQYHSLSATRRKSRPRMARVRAAKWRGTWDTVVPEEAARARSGFLEAWSWVEKVRTALP